MYDNMKDYIRFNAGRWYEITTCIVLIVQNKSIATGLKHTLGISNGCVLVIGSWDPWVESFELEA